MVSFIASSVYTQQCVAYGGTTCAPYLIGQNVSNPNSPNTLDRDNELLSLSNFLKNRTNQACVDTFLNFACPLTFATCSKGNIIYPCQSLCDQFKITCNPSAVQQLGRSYNCSLYPTCSNCIKDTKTWNVSQSCTSASSHLKITGFILFVTLGLLLSI